MEKKEIISLRENIKALYHDNKYYLYQEEGIDDIKNIFWIASNRKELNYINKKIEEYYKISKEFNDLELTGKRIIKENYYIEILKTQYRNRMFFTLYEKDKVIGSRAININGLTTFLALNAFTISGGSNLDKEYIGKGLGLLLYDTVDKTLPYQQIPHGYAGAMGCLTEYSRNFWENRRKNKTVPTLDKENEDKINYISRINQNIEIQNIEIYNFFNSLACLYENQFIENKNIYFDISYFSKDEERYYLSFLYPEKENLIQINEDILKEDVKKSFLTSINDLYIDDNYLSFDEFFKKIKEDILVKDDIIDRIIDDLNLMPDILNIYKKQYPCKYPDDIEIIGKIPSLNSLDYKENTVFASKNKNNYSIGIIKSEKYPYNNICRKIILFNIDDNQYLKIKKHGLDSIFLENIKKDNILDFTSNVFDINQPLNSRYIKNICQRKYFAKYDGKYFCSNMQYDKNISIDKITILTEMLTHIDIQNKPEFIQLIKQEILKQLPSLVMKNPTTIIDRDNNITRTLYGEKTNKKSLDGNVIKEIIEEKSGNNYYPK